MSKTAATEAIRKVLAEYGLMESRDEWVSELIDDLLVAWFTVKEFDYRADAIDQFISLGAPAEMAAKWVEGMNFFSSEKNDQ